MVVILFFGILFLLTAALFVLAYRADRAKYPCLKNAAFLPFSEEMVRGCVSFNCFSESVYSTFRDKNVMDGCRAMDDFITFMSWIDLVWDIRPLYPETLECGWASRKRVIEGYVPLVVSASALQDPRYHVFVSGVYADPSNHVIVRLKPLHRGDCVQYTMDPSRRCAQIYTLFYLKPELIDKISTLSFAIDRE